MKKSRKEWKIRQEIYHRTTEIKDDLRFHALVGLTNEKIPFYALRYFHVDDGQVYLPSKMYAVAAIYAKLLNKYFDEDIMVALNDPDLLYGNSPGFTTYKNSPKIYDRILKEAPLEDIEIIDLPQVQTTVKSFYDEFFIKHDCL